MAQIRNMIQVIDSLKRQRAKKLRALTVGLKMAGLYLQRKSQDIVPVDYGPLKASAFTRSEGGGTSKVKVQVGYTAAYAVYVHEDLDKAHGSKFNAKYAAELAEAARARKKRTGGTTGPFRHNRGENQQAKFLEQPFRQMQMDSVVPKFVAAELQK